jgi:predicted nucleic-acid-binding Zn-ribbon protein
MQDLEFRHHASRNFTCLNCQGRSATNELMPIHGETKSDLSKFSIFDMILIECKACGYIQFFDKYFLPESDIWGSAKA